MGLYVSQNDQRSQLQEKLAKELQDRAKQKADPSDLPDGVDDSAYLEGTKRTTSLAGVWIVIIALFIALVVWILIATA